MAQSKYDIVDLFNSGHRNLMQKNKQVRPGKATITAQSQTNSQHHEEIPGRVAQSVTCLAADPGVASSIPARSHTFAEIDREIISRVILLPSTDSRRVVVSYK